MWLFNNAWSMWKQLANSFGVLAIQISVISHLSNAAEYFLYIVPFFNRECYSYIDTKTFFECDIKSKAFALIKGQSSLTKQTLLRISIIFELDDHLYTVQTSPAPPVLLSSHQRCTHLLLSLYLLVICRDSKSKRSASSASISLMIGDKYGVSSSGFVCCSLGRS